MLKLRCKGCQQSLGVPDTFEGRRVRCPQCNRVLHVPAADSDAGPAMKAKAPPAAGVASKFSDYLQTSKAAVSLSLLIMLFGVFWLLSELGVLPPFHWVWTLGLASTGVLTLWLGGINQRTLVIGPFLMVCAVFSVLRQKQMINLRVEIPSLVIAFGALSLMVIFLGYTQPDLLEEDD